MAHAEDRPAQPPLSELFSRYLQRQSTAQEGGFLPAEPRGEVVPFEAAPAQPVDPRLAWDEALVALHCFHAETSPRTLPPPAVWATLVADPEPAFALPLCTGNYPQLVRKFQPLLEAQDLGPLRPTDSAPLPADVEVRGKSAAEVLVRFGLFRLTRQFDAAGELLRQRGTPQAEWQAAWANEEAALAWHRGRAEEAAGLWRSQADSTPVLFNRGMAALFLGQPREARRWLTRAVDRLPDASGWHHLGRLYLALAELRD